jgi:hypothetical protein
MQPRDIDDDEADFLICIADAAHSMARHYLADAPDELTAETLDAVLDAWFDDPTAAVEVETLRYAGGSKPPAGVVRDALGATLGGILIDRSPDGTARWVHIVDDTGTTYAVALATRIVFPFDAVAKRIESGERRGLAPLVAVLLSGALDRL